MTLLLIRTFLTSIKFKYRDLILKVIDAILNLEVGQDVTVKMDFEGSRYTIQIHREKLDASK